MAANLMYQVRFPAGGPPRSVGRRYLLSTTKATTLGTQLFFNSSVASSHGWGGIRAVPPARVR